MESNTRNKEVCTVLNEHYINDENKKWSPLKPASLALGCFILFPSYCSDSFLESEDETLLKRARWEETSSSSSSSSSSEIVNNLRCI